MMGILGFLISVNTKHEHHKFDREASNQEEVK